MAPVASQLIEKVTAHAQSDRLEDAREICADGTYVPNNLRICCWVQSSYCCLVYAENWVALVDRVCNCSVSAYDDGYPWYLECKLQFFYKIATTIFFCCIGMARRMGVCV